jgi:hypothetical protein
MRRRPVRYLADNLNDNVVERGLRVDIANANLAVLETELLDVLGDGLRTVR